MLAVDDGYFLGPTERSEVPDIDQTFIALMRIVDATRGVL